MSLNNTTYRNTTNMDMKQVFKAALTFQERHSIPEPPTIRGYMHDYLHEFFHVGISISNEALIQEIEWVLDGVGGSHNGAYPEYLASTLPEGFLALWNKHSN